MAKKVVSIKCPGCGALYRTKLKRGVPIRSCPECSRHVVAKNEPSDKVL